MRLHARLLVGAVVAVLTVLGVQGVAQAGGGGGHGHGHDREVVKMRDDCNAASFNAAFGPGTCVGRGDTTVDEFLAQLRRLHNAPKWRFSPLRSHVDRGDVVVAKNRGGEVHTFTEVKAFGGGCVAPLNEILRLTPVPECGVAGLQAATSVDPGGRLKVYDLGPGRHYFECLIHPWMRAVVTVRGHHGHH